MGGKTVLAEVNALKPKVATLESKVATLENKPAVPSPNAYVIEVRNNENNWYRKWSDGFIEQGGVVINAFWTNEYNEYVTFPVAFKNIKYNLQLLISEAHTGHSTGKFEKVTNTTPLKRTSTNGSPLMFLFHDRTNIVGLTLFGTPVATN